MSVTQAMRFLDAKKIPYEIREYDFRVKGAEYAAEALGWPPESMIKTLVAGLDKRFVLSLMPAGRELSLKKLARVAGGKNARMSTVEEAEKQTGYLVGGISPFGVRKAMEVWMEESLTGFEKAGINGGRRGCIIFLSPKDIRESLGAKTADLTA
ncbi:aminoacyl-tRNA deacylase [bacterium]|nr:MAG: aminoacyl-tRNA deacylase [bacterium]